MNLATGHTFRGVRENLGRTVLNAPAIFVTGTLVALAIPVVTRMIEPGPSDLPAIAVIFFLLASIAALLGWLSAQGRRDKRLTYWDVAGAFTFAGICVAAMVEPEQLVSMVETSGRPR